MYIDHVKIIYDLVSKEKVAKSRPSHTLPKDAWSFKMDGIKIDVV